MNKGWSSPTRRIIAKRLIGLCCLALLSWAAPTITTPLAAAKDHKSKSSPGKGGKAKGKNTGKKPSKAKAKPKKKSKTPPPKSVTPGPYGNVNPVQPSGKEGGPRKALAAKAPPDAAQDIEDFEKASAESEDSHNPVLIVFVIFVLSSAGFYFFLKRRRLEAHRADGSGLPMTSSHGEAFHATLSSLDAKARHAIKSAHPGTSIDTPPTDPLAPQQPAPEAQGTPVSEVPPAPPAMPQSQVPADEPTADQDRASHMAGAAAAIPPDAPSALGLLTKEDVHPEDEHMTQVNAAVPTEAAPESRATSTTVIVPPPIVTVARKEPCSFELFVELRSARSVWAEQGKDTEVMTLARFALTVAEVAQIMRYWNEIPEHEKLANQNTEKSLEAKYLEHYRSLGKKQGDEAKTAS